MPRMELKDYVSNSLSLVAIVISILVWRTTDTRASELREKTILYAVEEYSSYTDATCSGPPDDTGFPTCRPDDKEDIVDKDLGVRVTIKNTGKLPVKDVSLTISTAGSSDQLPYHVIDLSPAMAHEETTTGSDLGIHLKNPLGPSEQVVARVSFQVRKDRKPLYPDFRPREAFVESEVGAATLIGSFKFNFDKGTINKNGSMPM